MSKVLWLYIYNFGSPSGAIFFSKLFGASFEPLLINMQFQTILARKFKVPLVLSR